MDGQIWSSLLKLIIFLPVVLILAYLSLRIGKTSMLKMGGGRIIKIVERVSLSPKSSICIAVIDDKAYVIGATEERVEILMELSPETMEKLMNQEKSCSADILSNFNRVMNRKDRL